MHTSRIVTTHYGVIKRHEPPDCLSENMLYSRCIMKLYECCRVFYNGKYAHQEMIRNQSGADRRKKSLCVKCMLRCALVQLKLKENNGWSFKSKDNGNGCEVGRWTEVGKIDRMIAIAKLESKLESKRMDYLVEAFRQDEFNASFPLRLCSAINDAQKEGRGVRRLSEIFHPVINDRRELVLVGGVGGRRKGRPRGRNRGRGGKVVRYKRRGMKKKENAMTNLTRPGQFAPDEYQAVLVYSDTATERATTGTSNAMNWRYRTSAYDPDPSILSGAIPGFTELANLYGFYRVISINAEVQIGAYETNQCTVVVWPSATDNNANSLSKDDLMEVSGNPYARVFMIGNSNTVPSRFRTRLSPKKLLGPNYYTDLDYAAATSTNPAALLYMNVGVFRNSGNFSYAVAATVKLFYKVRFFGRRQLFSLVGSRFVYGDTEPTIEEVHDDSTDEKVAKVLEIVDSLRSPKKAD